MKLLELFFVVVKPARHVAICSLSATTAFLTSCDCIVAVRVFLTHCARSILTIKMVEILNLSRSNFTAVPVTKGAQMHSPVTSSHLAVLGHEHAWQSGKPKYSGSHLAKRKILIGDYSITKGVRG